MGLYNSGASTFGGNDELQVHEGYEGTYGVQKALIEAVENDLALFEGVICSDIQEQFMTNAVNEGAVQESELQAFTEATGSGLVDKIKTFLKKVWEKIKSIINSFIVMITNVVIRDNKEFVNKYRTNVLKKDLTKMKFKWSECKSNKNAIIPDSMLSEIEGLETAGTEIIKSVDANYSDLKDRYAKDEANYRKDMDKIKDDKYKEYVYKNLLGLSSVDLGKLEKNTYESLFNDLDEKEGLDSGLLTEIMNLLCESGKILKSFKTAESKTAKIYNDRLKEIDKARTDVAKAKFGDGDGDSRNVSGNVDGGKNNSFNKNTQQSAIKALNTLYTVYNLEQETITKTYSIFGSIYKQRVKQCRAVFARAAAFNDKSVKEDTILMEAMDDVQHQVVEELFEGMYA